MRRGALFRSYTDAAISALNLAQVPIEVDQPATLTGMFEGGLGVSLLPALSCPTAALRSVVSRPLVRPEVSRQIAFWQNTDRECMPAVQEFVRVALEYLAANTDSLPEGCDVLPVGARLSAAWCGARASRGHAALIQQSVDTVVDDVCDQLGSRGWAKRRQSLHAVLSQPSSRC